MTKKLPTAKIAAVLKKFFSRIRKKENDNFFLALDVGTEFVKAFVVRREGGHGFIVGASRIRQRPNEMAAGFVSDIGGVASNAAEAIRQATRMAGVEPEQAVMGIAGEFVRGASTRIAYVRENPEKQIDLAELKSIVQKVQSRSFEEVRSQFARETANPAVDIKLVGSIIIDSRIDSNRVSNPVGFTGKSVELSVFNSFAPLTHFAALQTIAAECDLDLLTIATEPYAVARILENNAPADHSAIFIDVGGGTTDLALLQNGRDLITKMFAIGGRSFTKRIARDKNISFAEAEKIKIEYSQNKLDVRSKKIVKDALAEDVEVWLAGIQVALEEMLAVIPGKEDEPPKLPAQIFLCGGGSKLPEIRAALESAAWTRDLPFSRRPSVRFLVPDDAVAITDETGIVRGVNDITPVALANLGLELSGEESLVSQLSRKAAKLLQN